MTKRSHTYEMLGYWYCTERIGEIVTSSQEAAKEISADGIQIRINAKTKWAAWEVAGGAGRVLIPFSISTAAPNSPAHPDGYYSPWTDSPHASQYLSVDSQSLQLLGQRIRSARTALGWTQEDLAAAAEIDRSYIGGVERGERNLTFTVLCQICSALGSDVAKITKGIPVISG